MKKAKVAVVGLGTIGQNIHLPVLTRLNDAEVVAVCDLDKTKARVVAEKFGVSRWYVDYSAMLAEEEEVVGVDICTPTKSHRDMAVAALQAGKNVLVEKPLARSQTEANDIVETAKRKHLDLMVGMNNRFRPDAMILRSFIEDHALGKIFYAKAGWFRKLDSQSAWFAMKEQSGGGVVLDLGIVMFDLAFWMMGYPEVKEVTATNYRHSTKDVEDSSIVFMKMKNGSTLTIEASWSFESNSDFFYCDVFGTEGSGSLNPFRIVKRMHDSLVNVAPVVQESSQALFMKSYENELKHWVGSLRGVHPVLSTGEEAVYRMRIVDAIYKSAKMGKAVAIR
ncbi:MAG: Gfo/Idh/MocA family oxidoreductase [Ignavibacteriales bacterium]|nr:Gfo/Idh/MocA family oxidoreductase [Ignavibacteriales bacterium]